MTLLLITLGVAASLAESIGITLLVLLIYVALAGPAAAVDITGILQTVLTYLGDWSGDSRVFVAVLVVVMIAAKLILTFANAILGSRISNRISELTRNRIFAQLFDVSYSEINRYDRGELLSVLATESFSVAAVHACFIRICVNSGAVLVFAAFLLATSWQITLIAVAGAIIRAAAIRLFSQPITRIGAEAAATNKAMAELILASLQGMRTIRAFAGEAVQKKRFTAVSRAAKTALIRAEQIGCLAGTIGEFMTLSVLSAVLIVSAPLGIPFPAVLAAMALIYRLQPHLREFEWRNLSIALIILS
jgi:ABC-type multidrug transport system fused ATPase/permease subunit